MGGRIKASARPAPCPGVLDRSHAGTAAPAFTFENGEGKPITMAAFRGRPVLVNLWATWCAPCIVEMPSLDALALREGRRAAGAGAEPGSGRAAPSSPASSASANSAHSKPISTRRWSICQPEARHPAHHHPLRCRRAREVWRMVGVADWESERVARLLDEAEAG
jgi:hypothetical protein